MGGWVNGGMGEAVNGWMGEWGEGGNYFKHNFLRN